MLFGLAHVRLVLAASVIMAAVLVSLSTGGCPTTGDGNDNATANDNSGDNSNGTDGNTNENGGGTSNDNENGTDGNSNDNGTDNTNGGVDNGNTNDNSGGNANDNSGGNGNDNTGGNTNDNGVDPGPAPTSVSLERIVNKGDQVPDQPVGCAFTAFGNPIIDSTGRVAFWATFSGGNGAGGLYVWENGTIKKVVDDDASVVGIVPGRTTQDYFGKFVKAGSFDPLTQALAWGAGDRLIFNSEISGEKRSAGIFRWRATDETIVRVADMEQIAALLPDTYPNGAALSPDFLQAGVSDGGLVVFVFMYTYFRNPTNEIVSGRGVFTSNGTTLTVVADSTLSQPGDVPDAGANAFFDDFRDLTAVAPNGDFLFNGQFDDGDDGSGGAYLGRAGAIYRVVDNRATSDWPGLAADTKVGPNNGRFDALALGSGGFLAIDTKITDGGVQRDAVLRYDFDANTWIELTGAGGAAATALLTGVSDNGEAIVISGGNPFLTNGDTSVAVNELRGVGLTNVGLTWAAAGGAINNNLRGVLPYTRTTGSTPGLAFFSGEQLLIAADPAAAAPGADVFAITTVSGPEIDRPARSGLLNDLDQLVFRALTLGSDSTPNTSDDGQAIYLGTAE